MQICNIIIINFFLSIFDIEALIRYGGLLIIFLVVYASTGLFFCFFLPSGAVLFTGGVFVATGALNYNIITVGSLMSLACILGNCTGYWVGRKAGPSLYKRKDSRFYKRQYLKAAEDFYRKYSDMALTAAFFLPIIRSFAPVVAGMVKLPFRRFILPTIIGSLGWIASFVYAGYFIGSYPLLKPWLNYIVIFIILVVTLPVVTRIVKGFRKWRRKNEGNQ